MVSSSTARLAFYAACGLGGFALGLKCAQFVFTQATKRTVTMQLVNAIKENVAYQEDLRRTTEETEGRNIGRVSCVTPQAPHDDDAGSPSGKTNEFSFKGHSGGYQ